MKIETLTKQQALELMGNETTDAEAMEMLKMLALQDRWTDTDEISDAEWVALVAESVKRS